ncbi:S-layer homology domain-containing protein [Paenibacillus sp. 1P07SE]|uniref:S-layer homology domain-containing protein n=1 Tax=Paenibacillus sp. 1P07SE TaxID=3132209 RepID=UPI0039A5EE29
MSKQKRAFGSVLLSFLMVFMTLQPMGARADSLIVEAPTFNIDPGVYEHPQTVSLHTDTPEAVIRYTLDGSEPHAGSPAYATPILIEDVTQIRAYVEGEGGLRSEPVEGLYVIAETSMEWSDDFSTFDPGAWQWYAGQTTNGTWSEAEGQLVANRADGSKAMMVDLTGHSPQHFIMEADINPYNSLQNSGFVFRVTEPGAGADTMSGYFVGFASNGTLAASKMTRDGSTGRFALIHRLEGANAAEVTPNAMNRLKVVGLGPTYYVYLNDTFQFKFTDKDHAIGTFGIRAWNTAGNAAFDNIRITALSSDRIPPAHPDLSAFAVDHFDAPALDGEWTIFQEDADKWSLSQHPGYLSLQTTATDLYQANNTLNNVFLREAPENFEIVASLHAPILRNHQQAGLIVMQDADNYYKLGQVWNQSKLIETGYEKEGTYSRGGMTDHPGGLQIQLKIRKAGNQYTSYYWSEGNWVQAAEPVTLDMEDIKIGVYGNNNVAPDHPITVRVDYVGIKSVDDSSHEEEPETPEVEQAVISMPNTGLEAWYKMDEEPGSFFALDSSGNYRHSFVTYGTWLPDGGVDGGAISLNGTSDRIALNGPSGTFLRNEFSQYSASLWFKANKTITRQVLFERGGNVAGLAIQLNNNKLEAAVVSASNRHVLSVDFTDTSAWHHVLVTFDQGDFKLYLDGVLAAQKDTGIPVVASALNVGAIGWRAEVDAFGGAVSGAHFEGLIDDVRLYVTVVVPTIGEVPAESIQFGESEIALDLGESHTVIASLLPVNTTNSELIWVSSEPSVVHIDSTEALRANVTAVSPGMATITATTVDGEFTADVDISVTAAELQSARLSPVRITLPVGVDYVMTTVAEPGNAMLPRLQWSSDNMAVAVVDDQGKVTTLAPGRTVIEAATEAGDIIGAATITVEEEQDSPPIYMMSYFRSDIAQTGQKDEYLHLAYSRDGLRWYELNNNRPVADFDNPLRDPFIAQGEDGIWRLMFTGATVNGPNSKGIFSMLGYAESTDLIHWTNYKMLDVMKAYKDRGEVVFNSWAPEWSYDPVNEEYVIYWSSTVGNYASGDNKHYYMTTKDWQTFSDADVFFAPDHKTIDASMYSLDADEVIEGQTVREKLGIPDEQVIPGNQVWMMFYKDETHENQGGMRNRQTWSAEGIVNPESYEQPGRISDYVTPSRTEGASIFKVGERWHMLYDYWWAGKFGLKTTTDLTDPSAWSEEHMDLRIPFRARHAGMSIIDTREMWNLIHHYSLESRYPFLGGAKDDSGRGHDGEVLGNPTFAGPGSGESGYAEFDGAGDAIRLGHLDPAFYNRTVSMWVKADQTGDAQMLYQEGNHDGGLALKLEDNQLIAGVVKEQVLQTVRTDFAAGDWRLVTVVYEEGLLKLYIDGVLTDEVQTGFQPKQSSLNQDGASPASRNPELYDVERGSRTATIAAGSEMDVFGEDSSTAYFEGRVGQLGLYELPLFAEDIAELYDREKPAYEDKVTPPVPPAPQPPYYGGHTPPQPPAGPEHDTIIVNGVPVQAGAATTSEVNGQRVTTVELDEAQLQRLLETEGERPVVTIPAVSGSDVIIGVLNGRLFRDIAARQGMIEVHTERASYRLPAAQVNIDAMAEQFGAGIALQDIQIKLELAELSAADAASVRTSLERAGLTPVVEPLDFKVSAAYGDHRIDVSRFGAYVERTMALAEEIDTERVTTGVVVEADGTIRHVPTKLVEIDGKYHAQLRSLTNSVYAVVWHPVEFMDTRDHWAAQAVSDMGGRLIVNGTGADRYSPDRDITRAEFAAIAVRGLGIRLEEGPSPFTDVQPADWFASAVQTAYAYGLIHGYEDGTFRPHEKITREQAMLIMSKAMAITGLTGAPADEDADRLLADFSDIGEVAGWALTGVRDSVGAGIISGRSRDMLAPKAFMTRAEVATIMQRLLQRSGLIDG